MDLDLEFRILDLRFIALYNSDVLFCLFFFIIPFIYYVDNYIFFIFIFLFLKSKYHVSNNYWIGEPISSP